ncbi:hypothetical protein MUK42_36904 [Musa troglodytarum]|uniref:Uncharacterized protein n=1 Tax=Musa troglodytarum TaxID=320322 RepID=A0A9E7GNQ8_9LILI|nr:hypothetical protein MUK42_36904 [Musa troglodytarum]
MFARCYDCLLVALLFIVGPKKVPVFRGGREGDAEEAPKDRLALVEDESTSTRTVTLARRGSRFRRHLFVPMKIQVGTAAAALGFGQLVRFCGNFRLDPVLENQVAKKYTVLGKKVALLSPIFYEYENQKEEI